MEHQQGAGGLEEAGKSVATGGGGHTGVRPVLQGGDTGSSAVQVRNLGAVRHNDAGDRGNPHAVSKAYNW